jgi:hypothetical protein
MPRAFAADVPILQPFFQMLDALCWRGARLRDSERWFVMGQICIAQGYRGRGIVSSPLRLLCSLPAGARRRLAVRAVV